MLKSHGVLVLADVRRFAGSRRLPHFNAEHLSVELPRIGIEYVPCPLLGGRRRSEAGSPNVGWRNESFRAYADYMQTPEFREGLRHLMAERRPLAMMCAEAVPWRCHRSLIADALIVRGWEVLDIMSASKAALHKLTPFARVNGTSIIYDRVDAGRSNSAPVDAKPNRVRKPAPGKTAKRKARHEPG